MKKALSLIISILMVITMLPSFAITASATDYQGVRTQASSLQTGDTFQLGNYPQTKVTDSATINALNNISCTMNSYGYIQNSYSDINMLWVDVRYNGNLYRKVYIGQYRPYNTTISSNNINSLQDENGYSIGNTYYFKWEPIVWQVLGKESDGLYVTSTLSLDSQAYDNVGTNVSWENTSIRNWLNNTFYNIAFSYNEKTKINNTIYNGVSDNICILSFNEALNADYGFIDDDSRIAKSSDYAKIQGISVNDQTGTSVYLLRDIELNLAGAVYNNGQVVQDNLFNFCDRGVRPALKLNLNSEIYKSDSAVGGVAGNELYTSTGYKYNNEFAETRQALSDFSSSYVGKYSSYIPGIEQTVSAKNEKSHNNFELCNDMVTQGLCFVKYNNHKYMVITAYCFDKKHSSVLYIMSNDDPQNRQLLTTISLGGTSHVGGVTYFKGYLWLCNTKSIQAVKFSSIYSVISDGEKYKYVKYEELDYTYKSKVSSTPTTQYGKTDKFNVKCRASFITNYGSRLYIGEYNQLFDMKTDDYAEDIGASYLYGYDVDVSNGKLTIVKNCKAKIPFGIQGVDFVERGNTLLAFLTAGNGSLFSSSLKIYTAGFNKSKSQLSLTPIKKVSYPTMLEEVKIDRTTSAEYIYSCYESASNTYHLNGEAFLGVNTIKISDRIAANKISKLAQGISFSLDEDDADDSNIVTFFDAGDDISATLYDDGSLEFYGFGELFDESNLPVDIVNEYGDIITSVSFSDGITTIPANFLSGLNRLTSVYVNNCTCDVAIGEYAFSSCINLDYVSIGKNDTLNDCKAEIGYGAFSKDTSINTVVINLNNANIADTTFIEEADLLICSGTINGNANHTHTFEQVDESPATCANDEMLYFECKDCGYSYQDIGENKTDTHIYEDDYCVICGDVDPSAVEVCDHEFGEYDDYIPATCTTNGTEIAYCVKCGEAFDMRESFATGHHYDEEIIEESTCVANGNILYTCIDCDDSYTEVAEINPDNHNYIETSRVLSDCSNLGFITYNCSYCDETLVEPLTEYGDHNFEKTSTVQPTCTTDGYDIYTCSICGEAISDYTEELHMLSHNYEKTSTVQPTCTADGYEIYTCVYCGDEDIRYPYADVLVDSSLYPQSAHNYSNNMDKYYDFSYDEAKNLTITFSSSTKVESSYDYIYIYDGKGDQLGKYTGTSLANKSFTIEGDSFRIRLTSDGSQVYYGFSFSSIVANVVNNEELAMIPHSSSDYTIENRVASSCNNEGSYDKVQYCEACGYEMSRETISIPETGHIYIFNEFDSGIMNYTCDYCEQEFEISASDLYAQWDVKYVNTKPTSTKYEGTYIFDVVQDGIINGKDYAKIYNLQKVVVK